MKSNIKRANGGFTLIEVILSMAILAIISLPLLKYFTDSIRYSQLMERKQQATVMAQETLEQLKAAKVLIEKVDVGGTSSYTVPFLLDMGYSEVAGTNTLNNAGTEGRGSAVFKKSTAECDVLVSLNTDSVANSIVRPVVFSIDDTQDVLAVERDQYNEAIIYFMALHSSYISAQPTPAPGGTPATILTKEQIEQNTSRVIKLSMDKDAQGYYVVQGYYEYTCVGLEGEGSSKTMNSSPIIDVRTKELRSIYLLYDRMKFNASEPAIDHMEITKSAELSLVYPNLVIICQNLEDFTDTDLENYKMQITYDDDLPLSRTAIRTNLKLNNILDAYGASAGGTASLSQNDTPVRIVNLEVSVYPAGGADGSKEPYTTFTSTKGE